MFWFQCLVLGKILRRAAPPTQKNSNQTKSHQVKCPCLIDNTLPGGQESMVRGRQREHTFKPKTTCSSFRHKLRYPVRSGLGSLGVGVQEQNVWQAESDTSNSILNLEKSTRLSHI